MKFSAKHDIDAPSAFVFGMLSDFDGWERAAMRRGADVVRTDRLTAGTPGMSWRVNFTFRGRKRQVDLKLIGIAPMTKLEFSGASPAMNATMMIDIVEMSSRRSRLHMTADITPLTLSAKLFIQSLRLARARMDRKFAKRVANIATDIEARYRAEQKPS